MVEKASRKLIPRASSWASGERERHNADGHKSGSQYVAVLFGLQLPVKHTALSIKWELYFFKEVFVSPLFIASICILHVYVHIYYVAIQHYKVGLQHVNSKAVIKTIEVNLLRSIRSVSSEIDISQTSSVRSVHVLGRQASARGGVQGERQIRGQMVPGMGCATFEWALKSLIGLDSTAQLGTV